MDTRPELSSNKQGRGRGGAVGRPLRASSRSAGHDVHYMGAAGDVQSEGRVIEVKAFGRSNRGFGLCSRPGRSRRRGTTRTSTSTSLRTSGRGPRRSSP
jgi:hypothetical protein